MVLLYIIISVIIVSLISLLGILTLGINKKFLSRIISLLVAFSAGTLLAAAFLELIPESLENYESLLPVIIGIMLFFLIEAIIHWHHHHEDKDRENISKLHPVVFLSLIGDAIHNLLDGIIIGTSYLVSVPSGIATTIAIAAHEIPQEIGDFAVLINGGLSRSRALLLNFISALFAIVGAMISYSLLSKIESIIPIANLVAAGGLIYIATTDLFPRLHEERDTKKVLLQTLGVIIGIMVIALLVKFVAE